WGNREILKEIALSQGQNQLNHATWECKHHVVFTPKYRKKLLFGQIRWHLGNSGNEFHGKLFRELAQRKECRIEEGPEVFGGRGDRVYEREELDLDCAECRTQVAQFSGPQGLGQGVLCCDDPWSAHDRLNARWAKALVALDVEITV